ncbi:unnamed protein product [Ixodes pacificus]
MSREKFSNQDTPCSFGLQTSSHYALQMFLLYHTLCLQKRQNNPCRDGVCVVCVGLTWRCSQYSSNDEEIEKCVNDVPRIACHSAQAAAAIMHRCSHQRRTR